MASLIFQTPVAPEKKQICQTCSERFNSAVELRRHIAYYQLEEQQLVSRLLEIQAHLPPTHLPKKVYYEHSEGLACQTCFESFDSRVTLDRHIAEYQREQQLIVAALSYIHSHSARQSHRRGPEEVFTSGDLDDGTRDNVSNSGENGRTDAQYNDFGSLDKSCHSVKRKRARAGIERICPHPECHDKQRRCANSTLLYKHFQKHVSCLDICVYCRDIFAKVSSARRHDCENRQRIERNEQFRQSSRLEMLRANRHKQLAYRSEQEMNKLLGRNSAKQRRKPFGSGISTPQQPCMKIFTHSSPSHDTAQGMSILRQDIDVSETQPPDLQPTHMPPEWNASCVSAAEASQMLDGYAGIFFNAALPPFYQSTSPILSTVPSASATDYSSSEGYAGIFLHDSIAPIYSAAPQ